MTNIINNSIKDSRFQIHAIILKDGIFEIARYSRREEISKLSMYPYVQETARVLL